MIMVCLICIVLPKEAATSMLLKNRTWPACCLPGGFLCCLKSHVFLNVWKCITQLFVCFCLPYKQFDLLLGKRNNVSREHTHTRTRARALAEMLCPSVQYSQIILGLYSRAKRIIKRKMLAFSHSFILCSILNNMF